ncbi:O-antigen ligase family protein [Glutamicibacter sp. NPDC087344]|uniref:O-antigen ligase family protein n=1 Tax=Glutamicibacter sp. NPDC087344 TaxID=3363994 RepID=UPI0037FE008B
MLKTAPSASVSEPTKTQKPRIKSDAVSGLTVYVVLMFLVPSDRVVAQLGGSGTPSVIFAIGLLIWWLWFRARRSTRARFPNPVVIAFILFCVAVLASEVVAATMTAPIMDRNAADTGLIKLASYAGVFFVAADGIPSFDRLMVLIRRLVFAGALIALLGAYQFVTGTVLIDRIPTPGLAGTDAGIDIRGGYMRPRGTARHALEFAAVIVTILPLALALCVGDQARRMSRRLVPVVLLVLVSLMSLTRSALIGLVLCFMAMFPFWDSKVRRITILSMIAGVGAAAVAFPQLVRTIGDMFSSVDSSVNSRTDSYGVAFEIFSIHPWFGRGFGTFLPSYRILDNQLLQLLIEIGIVGILSFLGVLLTSVYCIFAVRKAKMSTLESHLGVGLAASIAVGASLMAFFDALSFPQAPGVLFLVLGLAAAYVRLAGEENTYNRFMIPVLSVSKHRAHVIATAAAMLVLLVAAPIALSIRATPNIVWAQRDVVFLPPASSVGGNSLRSDAQDLIPFATMVEHRYDGIHGLDAIQTVSAPIYGTGISSGSSVYVSNAGGQWQTYMTDAIISVEVVANSNEAVLQKINAITDELEVLAAQPQEHMKIIDSAHILTDTYPADIVPQTIAPRTKWALLLFGFLTLMGAGFAYDLTRRKLGLP